MALAVGLFLVTHFHGLFVPFILSLELFDPFLEFFKTDFSLVKRPSANPVRQGQFCGHGNV